MRRLTQNRVQRVAFSPIKKRMVVYTKCQGIAAADFFEYDMNALQIAYNEEFARQNVDVYVESCKKIRGMHQDNLLVDLWVATESPIAAAVVGLIILILKLVAISVAAIYILSAASAFVETLLPRTKFYAPDGTEFTDLAAYLTYMRNWNTGQGYPYTCMYCGQGFRTEAERDAHQLNCPWKGGPPSPTQNWLTLALIGLTIVAAIVIVPKVIDVIPKHGT